MSPFSSIMSMKYHMLIANDKIPRPQSAILSQVFTYLPFNFPNLHDTIQL